MSGIVAPFGRCAGLLAVIDAFTLCHAAIYCRHCAVLRAVLAVDQFETTVAGATSLFII